MRVRVVVLLPVLWLVCGGSPPLRAQDAPAPPASGVPAATQPATGAAKLSRITVPVHVPIALIRNDLQARIPKDQGGNGNGDTVCKTLFGMKLCVGTRYDYHIMRTGDVTVSPEGAGLRLGVPLRIAGHGGLRGAEAQALRLDAKAFRAAADVALSIGLNVRPDWCIEMPARIQYAWTEAPRVEIASGTWINIEGIVRKQLDARMNASAKRLSESVPCNEIQSALKRAWVIHVLPVKLSGVPDLALVIDPQSLGISDVAPTAEEVKVVLTGDARTYLTTAPPASLDKGPLPPPSPVSSEPERAGVAITINAPFALMRNVALQAAVRPISVSVGILSGSVAVTDLAFRQAGQKLAVDVTYRLSGISETAQQTGIAHLEGVPSVSADGRTITLKDATISPGSSGAFSPALAPVLNETLRLWLSRKPLVDLGPRLDEIQDALSGLSSDPDKTRGLRVTIRNVKIRLGEITTGPDGLTGTALAEGDVDADLASLKLP